LLRFAERQDQAAFEALLERHGNMVLRVCQRVLHNSHDAEDVFQATFLVLARKAAALRWHESVGGWLYEVAYRLSLEARAARGRLSRCESRVEGRTYPDPLAEISVREAIGILDEELNRLSRQYRLPLVLIHLEGTTQEDAARQLGWSLSTLKRRLGRGLELLRLRLMRRGLTLSAALSASLFGQAAAPAAVLDPLASATLRTALRCAGNLAYDGAVPAPGWRLWSRGG
jgi:RNA polymerase sigma factor (sigma-70 family)